MEALRQMRDFRKNSTLCFSPPVMLVTFAIELCLAGYVLWRYKLNRISRHVILLFIFLAIFQLAEYMVCGGLGATASTWARIGYMAITILPPLGLGLAYALAGKRNWVVTILSYAAAVGFMGYFLLATGIFDGDRCLGNYVIFQLDTVASRAYGVYYYGLLLLTVGLCWQFAGYAKPKQKSALQAFIAGYVLFMLPTAIVNTVNPATLAGIPSIMCGFAVVLAFVVSFWVMPLGGEHRK